MISQAIPSATQSSAITAAAAAAAAASVAAAAAAAAGSANASKLSRNYVPGDKENNADVVNAGSLEANSSQHTLKMRRQLTANDFQVLQHSRTEENFREIPKKLNADKVKRALLNNGTNDGKMYDRDEKCTLADQVVAPPVPEDALLAGAVRASTTFQSTISGAQTTTITGVSSSSSTTTIAAAAVASVVPALSQTTSSPSAQDEKYNYKKLENKNLQKTYSDDILEYMMRREKETTPHNCMLRHKIPANLRAKMVDWMIEVLSSYKCTEQTFFMAVRVMDMFFQKTPKVHEISDLHLVGVTSMFIACKYEEIYPMKLHVVHEKIAHRKLSIDQIKNKESEILQACGFYLIGATPYELAMHCLARTQLSDVLERKIYTYLEKICTYLSKMVLYDYELIATKAYALLAGALIFVSFKIIEQIDAHFKAEEKVKLVIRILKVPHDGLIETAAKILTLAKSFDKLYPNLDNLKKFNGFSLDEQQNQSASTTTTLTNTHVSAPSAAQVVAQVPQPSAIDTKYLKN